MARTLNVRITGVVQGVGYRAWAEQAARARGLSGWVRNRRDGSVEAVISGADDKVNEMLAYFWQGPGNSRVERVDSQPAPAPMQLGFRTLPTA
ncbi:MAG TPA: acylphosphatase [Devosia sp.]|jgi:acylphosphatase|nr:acylphosphatase [Devosia sp.]